MEDTTEIDWSNADEHTSPDDLGGLSGEGEEMTYYNGYDPNAISTTEEQPITTKVLNTVNNYSNIIIIGLLVIVIILLLARKKDR